MIKNVNYELAATFTRGQVLAVGKVAEFAGNIESDLKAGFPSSCSGIDWKQFRTAMTVFRELYTQDNIAVAALSKVTSDVNSGAVEIIAGRVHTKEKQTA